MRRGGGGEWSREVRGCLHACAWYFARYRDRARHKRASGLQNEEKAVAQARQVQSEGAK